jgi:hypothetical protein
VTTAIVTNTDVPLLAMEELVVNPKNPFSNDVLQAEKSGGVTIPSSQRFHHNIFVPGNWNLPLFEGT